MKLSSFLLNLLLLGILVQLTVVGYYIQVIAASLRLLAGG
jgi:hypothetical protein